MADIPLRADCLGRNRMPLRMPRIRSVRSVPRKIPSPQRLRRVRSHSGRGAVQSRRGVDEDRSEGRNEFPFPHSRRGEGAGRRRNLGAVPARVRAQGVPCRLVRQAQGRGVRGFPKAPEGVRPCLSREPPRQVLHEREARAEGGDRPRRTGVRRHRGLSRQGRRDRPRRRRDRRQTDFRTRKGNGGSPSRATSRRKAPLCGRRQIWYNARL